MSGNAIGSSRSDSLGFRNADAAARVEIPRL